MPSGRTKANLDSNEKRASLLAMPDFGVVRQVPSRRNPFIDFYPDIRDERHRMLWAFMGKGFKDEAEAQLVRNRINARALGPKCRKHRGTKLFFETPDRIIHKARYGCCVGNIRQGRTCTH